MKELQPLKYEEITRDTDGVIFLPKGVWFRLSSSDGNGFTVEAGWVSQDKASVSSCAFTDEGKLKVTNVLPFSWFGLDSNRQSVTIC